MPLKKQPQARDVQTPSIFSVSPYSSAVAKDMYPGQSGVDDQRDAARHLLAAGTLARKYGVAPAELLGKMHEWSTSPIEALKMMLGAAPTPDYLMDTRNNAYGAQLGMQARSQAELEDMVQREAERAQLNAPADRAALLKPAYAQGGSVKDTKVLKSGEGLNELTRQYPELSGFLQSFMGTAPDEMGGSVLDPLTARRRAGAEYGFPAGVAAQVAPGLGPLAKLAGRGAGAVARGGAEQIARAVEAGHPLTAGFAPMNVVKPTQALVTRYDLNNLSDVNEVLKSLYPNVSNWDTVPPHIMYNMKNSIPKEILPEAATLGQIKEAIKTKNDAIVKETKAMGLRQIRAAGHKDLTDDQIDAIVNYTQGSAAFKPSTSLPMSDKELTESNALLEKYGVPLYSALSNPLSNKVKPIYRGVLADLPAEQNMSIGDIIGGNAGPGSFSNVKSIANSFSDVNPVVFKVTDPSTAKGLDISKISSNPQESEVLIHPDQKFKILNILKRGKSKTVEIEPTEFEGSVSKNFFSSVPAATAAGIESSYSENEPGFAAGGLVNDSISGYNPARVDEIVNSLRTELFQ